MKVNKVICFWVLLLLLGLQNSKGQTWLWGKEGKSTNGSIAEGSSVACDFNGNVYTTGGFEDTIQIGSFILACPFSGAEAYLIKYNLDGSLKWVKQSNTLGIGFSASGNSVVTDLAGNLYLTGNADDTTLFDRDTVFGNFEYNGFFNTYSDNCYLIKYDSAGNVLWYKQSKGASTHSYSSGESVCTDNKNNVYITGYFQDTIGFGSNILSFNGTCSFIVKYDSSGSILWTKQSKGPGIFNPYLPHPCSVDYRGSIYVTGAFSDSIFFDSDTLIGMQYGFGDIFLVKYNAAGHIVWAKKPDVTSYYTTPRPYSMTIDKYQSIYIVGGFRDTINFGAIQLISEGNTYDIFIVKFDSSGNIVWAKTMDQMDNGTDGWCAYSIAADTLGNLYVSCGEEGTHNYMVRFDSTYFSVAIASTDGASLILKLDTSGKLLYGNIVPGGGDDENVSACSKDGNFIYFGGDLWSTVVFGDDTLVEQASEVPFVARWDGVCNTSVIVSPLDSTICSGSSVTLNASGATSYSWSPSTDLNKTTGNSVIATPTSNIIYKVIGSDSGCASSASITVNVYPSPNPLFSYNSKICIGEVDTLTASGGIRYLWSNGDTLPSIIVNPTSNTTYSVSVSNGVCSTNDSVSIQVFPYPVPAIYCKQLICNGQSDTIIASGGSFYLWNTGDTTASIIISPTTNSSYTVNISNGVCSIYDSASVTVNAISTTQLCCDSVITFGEKVQLISSGGQLYSWSPVNGLSCDTCPNPIASPGQTTTYTLTIVTDSGCVAQSFVTIDVSCGSVFIPEPFSPNGAGHNDILYVRGPCISTIDFDVFDRWGNKVFNSENLSVGWDGTYKGQPMTTGTYIWYLNATMNDGTKVEKKGNVALVR